MSQKRGRGGPPPEKLNDGGQSRKKQGHHSAFASVQAVWQPTEADVTRGFGDSDDPEALFIKYMSAPNVIAGLLGGGRERIWL